ncbi:hypothetical protein GPECTOR_149g29 [Gonium pectorale]|uniref:Major facilitator superfamily (MFS) profile domain-containing protein n=1 Tax=Gonium pectorale TaxID=33097 RepID=A0A150FXT7_GONPE|nr:hypothetical protein GPECTOR_149g29 [Gonium pectorale]|eukprot:KXZ42419.1 hypothetical protein GPECTOR_149g29 [Gonium pectorale]
MIIAGFIFAELAKHLNSFRLVGVGILCWSLGAVLTGATNSYAMLVVARTIVGCGEAPLLTLTFTFVDDVAPAGAATLWFGVLGVAPVLGAAAGYVLAEPLVAGLGWRGAFFLEAGLAALPAAFALLMPPVHLNLAAKAEAGAGAEVPGEGRAEQRLRLRLQPPSPPGALQLAAEFEGGGAAEGRDGAGGGIGRGACSRAASRSGGVGAAAQAPSSASRVEVEVGVEAGSGAGHYWRLDGGPPPPLPPPASSDDPHRPGPPAAASPRDLTAVQRPSPPPWDPGSSPGPGSGSGPGYSPGSAPGLDYGSGSRAAKWVIGLTSFWGPKAMKEMFSLTGSGPELVIGAITVGSGLAGTLAGGTKSGPVP